MSTPLNVCIVCLYFVNMCVYHLHILLFYIINVRTVMVVCQECTFDNIHVYCINIPQCHYVLCLMSICLSHKNMQRTVKLQN